MIVGSLLLSVLFGGLQVGHSLVDYTLFGLGHQRKVDHNKRVKLTEPTTCTGVEVFRYTEAVIDNFAPIEKQQVWEGPGQRYWVNKQFWGGSGSPVFVFIGGEGEESCSRLTSRMYVYDLAEQYGGLMINVEHRFYGESYPTADMSTENLQYLSSEQALADLARIITYLRGVYKFESSKVITVGGSYPGNMAAWFKLKYPHVTYASIASSAPLTADLDFSEYMDVVGQSIVYFSGQSCFDAFEAAADAIAVLANQGPNSKGYKTLDSDFKTCSPMQTEKDLSILLSDLMGNIQGTVQYNNEKNGIMNITNICDTMLAGSDPYTQFVALTAQYRKQNGQACEEANWNSYIGYLSNATYNPDNNMRPWTYQTCNEFGYYQTTNSDAQPFHSWTQLDLDFYREICFEGFDGWTKDPQISWMNNVYGDIRIAGTNIIFPAGTIDPWHALGVTNSTPALPQPSEVPLFILGTAHCHDLYAPANSDPESLTYAREVINEQVGAWLAE